MTKFIITLKILVLLISMTSCVENDEASKYSDKLVKMVDEFNGGDVDLKFLETCSKFEDTWVRKNCIGTIKFIACDANEKDYMKMLVILDSLEKDSDKDIREAVVEARSWIKEIRNPE